MLGEYQLQALGLDDEQKVEAARCYRLLEKYDAGLLTAVQHYIAYLEQANTSVSLSEAIGGIMEAKKQDGISAKYLADLRSKLGRFVAAFPEKLACDLTTARIGGMDSQLEGRRGFPRILPAQYRRNARIRSPAQVAS